MNRPRFITRIDWEYAVDSMGIPEEEVFHKSKC